MINTQSQLNKALYYIVLILNDEALVKSKKLDLYYWHRKSVAEIIPFSWLSPKQEAKYDNFDALCQQAPAEALKITHRFIQSVNQFLYEAELNASISLY